MTQAGRTGGCPGGRRRSRQPRHQGGTGGARLPGCHPHRAAGGDTRGTRSRRGSPRIPPLRIAAAVGTPWCRRLCHLHSLRRPGLELLRAAAALALLAAAVAQLPAQDTGTGAEGVASEAAAVLVSGPALRQSLPFLPPNTIEYQRGVYELTAAPRSAAAASTSPGTENRVEVFYTDAPVFRRGTWTESACAGRTVHALPEAGGTVVHYAWPQEQRHVFFRFAAVVEGNGTPPGGAGAAGPGNAAGAPGDAAAGSGNAAGAPGDAAADPRDGGAAPGATAVARSECDFIDAFLERFSFFLDTTDVSGAAPFPAVLPR